MFSFLSASRSRQYSRHVPLRGDETQIPEAAGNLFAAYTSLFTLALFTAQCTKKNITYDRPWLMPVFVILKHGYLLLKRLYWLEIAGKTLHRLFQQQARLVIWIPFGQ